MTTPELAGSWTYRWFNLAFVSVTPEEDALIRGPANLTLRPTVDSLSFEGAIDWEGPPPGGLVLNGAFNPVHPWSTIYFDITGTGRPGTDTDGWEYRYHGHRTRSWAEAPGQPPFLVGSVFRATSHNGRPDGWRSKAGEVFPFIAVQPQPDCASGLMGSWNYLSFRNMNSPYPYLKAAPTERGLILQEGEFKLVTPNPAMLRGTIEWSGGVLDIGVSGEVTPAEVGGLPLRFAFTGTGRSGTYHYYGYQTPWWQKGDDNQRSILVGSVFRKPSGEAAPVGSVYPFIAVKKQ